MQVIELINELDKLPEDGKICLVIGDIECEDFHIALSDDGYVCLEGD